MTPDFDALVRGIGLDPARIPPGTMGVAEARDYRHLSAKAGWWSQHPDNAVVLTYEIETEWERGAGLILRNLHSGPRKAHLTIPAASKPVCHNLTPALPWIWRMGVVVLCEGSKDARMLHQYDLPAVAYLGAAPSRLFLAMIRRYAHSVVWCPDHDRDIPPEVVARRHFTRRDLQKMGFGLREITLHCKDPGELDRYPAEVDRIRQAVDLLALTKGGGYRG